MGSIVCCSRRGCEFDRETLLNTAANQVSFKADIKRIQEEDSYYAEDILCLISSDRHKPSRRRKACVGFVDTVDQNTKTGDTIHLRRSRSMSAAAEMQSTKEPGLAHNCSRLRNKRESGSMVVSTTNYDLDGDKQYAPCCSNVENPGSHRRPESWSRRRLEPLPATILKSFAARRAARLNDKLYFDATETVCFSR